MFKPKASYDPATDALMIELAQGPATENEEVAEDVIVGFDDQNNVVSVEILSGASELLAPLIKAAKAKKRPA